MAQQYITVLLKLVSPYYHRICGNQKELKFIKLEKE